MYIALKSGYLVYVSGKKNNHIDLFSIWENQYTFCTNFLLALKYLTSPLALL